MIEAKDRSDKIVLRRFGNTVIQIRIQRAKEGEKERERLETVEESTCEPHSLGVGTRTRPYLLLQHVADL